MFEKLVQFLDSDTVYIRKHNNIHEITKDYTSVGTTKALYHMQNDNDLHIVDKMLDTIDSYIARAYVDGDSIIIAIYF